MIDIGELRKLFGLEETPYIKLGLDWCVDGGSLYFIEEGVIYSVVYDEKSLEHKGDIVYTLVDVQQFLGWEPAFFTKSLKLSVEVFEEKYDDLM